MSVPSPLQAQCLQELAEALHALDAFRCQIQPCFLYVGEHPRSNAARDAAGELDALQHDAESGFTTAMQALLASGYKVPDSWLQIQIPVVYYHEESDTTEIEIRPIPDVAQAQLEIRAQLLRYQLGKQPDTETDTAGKEPREEHGDLPKWDGERLELRYRGQIVKKIKNRSQATNLLPVLAAFEEEGWPHRIDDPLPYPASGERTTKTVGSLNARLRGLRFSADGSGRGFAWEPAD